MLNDLYERDNIAGFPQVVPNGTQPGVIVPFMQVDGAYLQRNISCIDQDPYYGGVLFGADHAYFIGEKDLSYQITTYDLGANVDTYIEIWYFDKSTAMIQQLLGAMDDDSGPGLGSQVTFQAPESTRYYVKIYNWNILDSMPGTSYKVTVTNQSLQ